MLRRTNKLHRGILCYWLISLYFLTTHAQELYHQVLEDFDSQQTLSKKWTAIGDIQVKRSETLNNNKLVKAKGRCAEVNVKKRGAIFVIKENVQRPEYERGSQIKFCISAEGASEETPIQIEFRIYSQLRQAFLWRMVEINSPEWQTVTIPLRFLRPSQNAHVKWKEVQRYAIYFRQSCRIKIDSLELKQEDEKSEEYLQINDLRELAFMENGEIHQNQHFALITNKKDLKSDAILNELDKLYSLIRKDFPLIQDPERKTICLIFKEEHKYRSFWKIFAKQFNATVGKVSTDGYALLSIAGSYYSDRYPIVRPIFIHETCHAFLAKVFGLSNSSEWLHEGLANYYQLNWTKQNIHQLTKSYVLSDNRISLNDLTNGNPISLRDYGKVTLFVKYLMMDTERRNKFFQAIQKMRLRCSTNLSEISGEIFGLDIHELERRWIVWAKKELKH